MRRLHICFKARASGVAMHPASRHERSMNERTTFWRLLRRIGTGLQLSDLNDQATVDALREAWLTHKIIAIHDFALTLDELQLVASYFGPFGEDPFFESLPSHPHVAEVKRLAARPPLFAGGWHSD